MLTRYKIMNCAFEFRTVSTNIVMIATRYIAALSMIVTKAIRVTVWVLPPYPNCDVCRIDLYILNAIRPEDNFKTYLELL
jgi:hypothetical protein